MMEAPASSIVSTGGDEGGWWEEKEKEASLFFPSPLALRLKEELLEPNR